MADEQTLRDHNEDLMDEIVRLRHHIRDLETQIRNLEVERDYWVKASHNE